LDPLNADSWELLAETQAGHRRSQRLCPGWWVRTGNVDAVAIILSDEGAQALSTESAAVDFVRDAFGHLKAIAADKGAQAFLRSAAIGRDAGVIRSDDVAGFIAAARTRQWDREKSVRTLA
jgi:catalase